MSKATPTVRWNEKKQRWMAHVRFPDGSRQKVEMVDRAAAENRLQTLLALRAEAGAAERRVKLVNFDTVIDAWIEAGAPALGPNVRHIKSKGWKTIKQVRSSMDTHVRPYIGRLSVDRTSTGTIETLFERMDTGGSSHGWTNKTWQHLNSACTYGQRKRLCKTNPAAEALLPEGPPPKERKSLTVDQARHLIENVLPLDRRPALWLTGLMCGLRPGELFGLRWVYVDLDGPRPYVAIDERADYDGNVYIGQAAPKGGRNSKRTIELHPLLVATLRKHRDDMVALNRYDDEGFVFLNRDGRVHSPSGARALMKLLFKKAGFGDDWTVYELRHSFVTLARNELGNLRAIADTVGHVSERTTQGYSHNVRPKLTAASEAWASLLESDAG